MEQNYVTRYVPREPRIDDDAQIGTNHKLETVSEVGRGLYHVYSERRLKYKFWI